MRLLNNLRLSTKLALIAIILAVPIGWMLTLAITEFRGKVALTEREQMGMEYIRPLIRILELTRDHDLLTYRLLAGQTTAAEDRIGIQSRIDEQVRKLTAVDRRLASELAFTEEGLNQRGRAGATVANLEREWEDLKRRSGTLAAPAAHAEHSKLCDRVVLMINHVFDTSTLVVDPDSDSFYIGFVLCAQLTHVQNYLGDALISTAQAIDRKTLTIEDHIGITRPTTIAAWNADLSEKRVKAALSEDVDFHGESPSLQAKAPPALKTFVTDFQAIADAIGQVNATEKPTTSVESLLLLGRKARESSTALWDLLDVELENLFQIRLGDFRRDAGVTLTITIVALVLGSILAFLVSQSMSKPLARCVQSLNALAEGDLSTRIAAGGRDEVGQMTIALAKAVEGMRSAILSIAGEASRLRKSSDEMADASRSMSATAEETSNQAGVVSAAAEQVSKSVQTVSVSTKEMAASIREVAKQATDAAKVATSGVKVAEATNTTVSKLGESSAEIGKVIKVITSIAEQTNLLALNATIEAARVGEAGKGFAVVANEVKELARETARATEDISRKIEAIQSDSKGVVTAINEIGSIINQINDIQGTIASAVEEQTLTTREIGRNVGEAANGASEIARNIQGVADAARHTSQGSQQTQSSAADLSRMAAALSELVARFKYE
ncbi:MAG: methyl-accepting chemotaxis protein [Isosphaeraceae bacterium]|nr:methyl-accepting chemotaxis protein [Isosphaeraceae bacterium]